MTTRTISFRDAFGVEFGGTTPGSGTRLDLTRLGLSGRTLNATFTLDAEGDRVICTGPVNTDSIVFDTTQGTLDRANAAFPNPSGAQVNIINRLTQIRDRAGPDAWFPWFVFATLNRNNAYPGPGRPLTVDAPFFSRFTDENGNEVVVDAVFQIPTGTANYIRKNTQPQIDYVGRP